MAGCPALAAAIDAKRKTCWDELRDMGPVVNIGGVYYLTGRAEVLAALHNPEVFSNKDFFSGQDHNTKAFLMVGALHPGARVPPVPTGFDAPELSRYHRILKPLFGRHAMLQLLPAVRRQAAALVDGFAAAGECEALSAVAVPYPAAVLLTMFGLPAEDRDKLTAWTDTMHSKSSVDGDFLRASLDLFGYLAGAMAPRNRPLKPGFLLGLVSSDLTRAEALGAAALTVFGGSNTVTNAVVSVLLRLASNPQLRALLRADPRQTKVFVDETLRLDAPAARVSRTATRDVTIGGVTIPAGSSVAMCLATINREAGDTLSVTGGQIARHRHWGFSAGPHRCPGAYLARMELTVLVDEWLARIPDFELAPGYSPPIPEVFFNVKRSCRLSSLPLRWDAIRPAPRRDQDGPNTYSDVG